MKIRVIDPFLSEGSIKFYDMRGSALRKIARLIDNYCFKKHESLPPQIPSELYFIALQMACEMRTTRYEFNFSITKPAGEVISAMYHILKELSDNPKRVRKKFLNTLKRK